MIDNDQEESMSTNKASAKVAKADEFIEFEMPDPGVGYTVNGRIFVTRHCCPSCDAEMETVGSGYPMFKCAKCNMPMVARSHEIKDED